MLAGLCHRWSKIISFSNLFKINKYLSQSVEFLDHLLKNVMKQEKIDFHFLMENICDLMRAQD